MPSVIEALKGERKMFSSAVRARTSRSRSKAKAFEEVITCRSATLSSRGSSAIIMSGAAGFFPHPPASNAADPTTSAMSARNHESDRRTGTSVRKVIRM